MKILYVAAEVVPFAKTGGLADVASSLPLKLAELGHDIRVVMPMHRQIIEKYKHEMDYVKAYYVDLNWRRQHVGLFQLEKNGVTYYFLDNEYYFNRNYLYGEFDDGERYAYFNKAVVRLLKEIDFKADVVHSNDWHSGLVNLFLYEFAKGDTFYQTIKKVFTIHNLKYQGVFPPEVLGEVMGVSYEYFNDDSIKYYDNINFMKAGIVYSDRVNTVSKSYAEEIKYPYFGEGLDGILNKHAYKLSGIINGIDNDHYNPETDPTIYKNYSLKTIEDKVENKLKLQADLSLPIDANIPMIGLVSRFSDMKGLDLIAHILETLLQHEVQLVILGTGEARYEEMFKHFAWRYPKKLSANIFFSNELANKIYAASDFFLMPSNSEPCGLSQLISLRYGTLPIVREVGGLKDTIIPFNQYTHEGNGFSFSNYNAYELLETVFMALDVYEHKPEAMKQLIQNAMLSDHSWDQSVQDYLKLYTE